jgi:hypothetical protein
MWGVRRLEVEVPRPASLALYRQLIKPSPRRRKQISEARLSLNGFFGALKDPASRDTTNNTNTGSFVEGVHRMNEVNTSTS